MKKMINFIALAAFILSASFMMLPGRSAQASLQEASYGIHYGKRCEKCQRGKDGKMVCKPVPCP